LLNENIRLPAQKKEFRFLLTPRRADFPKTPDHDSFNHPTEAHFKQQHRFSHITS